ncbi:ABC transporter permease [Dactylosporangium sp. CA-139066]|uniref:ABC transporter permease n=1 Tax=Dactylosporangium sp. CA-139066 TaxID=3239930 RepID=UPI003D89B9CC
MTAITLDRPAPKPFKLVRHSLELTKRSLIKTWRTPEALIDVTVQPGLFMIIFVYIFGGAVAGSTHSYLQFLMPGILAQTIAMGAISIGVNLNTDIEKGIFDRFRSLPIPRSAPLIGAVLGDVVRYVLVTISTFAFAYLLGFRIGSDPLQAVAGCLLAVVFGLCLSWAPVFIGMIARTSGSVQGIGFLVVLPLTFASNVFVGTGTLPSWMQGFVRNNPLSHLVEAMRGLFLGTPAYGVHVWWTLGWCAGLVAVFMPLALWAYRRKV